MHEEICHVHSVGHMCIGTANQSVHSDIGYARSSTDLGPTGEMNDWLLSFGVMHIIRAAQITEKCIGDSFWSPL
jgi:hypothetical protein